MVDIELAEMIKALRCELAKAQEEGDGEDIRFLVGEVELELTLAVSKMAKGGGGVKFWVYNVEAGVEAAEQRMHKIKLKLTPGKINPKTGKLEPMQVNAVGGLPE